MANKKNKAELEVENRYLKKARFNEGFVQVFLHLIRWGGVSYIAHQIYLSIDSLSGKDTLADIGLNVNILSDVKVSIALAWIIAVLSILYALRERTLRKTTIKRLQTRITMLEKEIDPKRTSSTLTPEGNTRQEDEL